MTFHSEETETFYCVWRDGFTPPTVKHKSFEMARAEALRLCHKHPYETFYVLKGVLAMQGTIATSSVQLH